MESGRTDTMIGQMDNDRVRWVLDQAYPGPHKAKRIARDFGVSPSMAKVLRAGRGWTLERMRQARRVIGEHFIRAIFDMRQPAEFEARLGEIVAEMAELRARLDKGG